MTFDLNAFLKGLKVPRSVTLEDPVSGNTSVSGHNAFIFK